MKDHRVQPLPARAVSPGVEHTGMHPSGFQISPEHLKKAPKRHLKVGFSGCLCFILANAE